MVTNLRTCDLTDPLGLETTRPALSWQLTGTAAQTGYHVRVEGLWDSGEVDSADQRVVYDGAPLTSRTAARWRVRVRDGAGRWSGWSREARFELGLLGADDWSAAWITHPDWYDGDDDPRVGEGHPLPLLAGEFTVAGPVAGARLYVAGLGVYVASVNGAPVTDAVLEPPYTDFARRVAYATHDVTALLRAGANALGIALGPGIAHVFPHQDRYMKFYGSKAAPKAIAQLEVRYADGTSERFGTGAGWLATEGPTTRSHWYGGEDHDARREIAGWDTPGTDRSGWRPATVRPDGTDLLRARACPPIRVTEELPAAKLAAADGTAVFDVGTVVAGWAELRLDLPAGHYLRLLPGDQLDAYGRVVQSKPTTGAPIFNTYVTKDGPQTWHPSFRYDGFRYVEAQGLPAHAGPEALAALVLRADNECVGRFETSDGLLNDIHTIIDRAVRGNMYSVLTDCPHREKLGWLEQAHLLFDVVAYNYDVAAYCRELLVTIAEAQTADGLVPDIAPEYVVFEGAFRDDANWGGAMVRVPWQLYRWYGDPSAMERHYGAMCRYVDYLTGRAEDGLLGHGLGDWFGLDDSTPVPLVATWGYWRAARTMAKVAGVLGRDDDAKRYRALTDAISAAFTGAFLKDGRFGGGGQASEVLALDMGVVPEELVPGALDRLSEAVRGGAITVGEIALPALYQVLTRAGRHEALWGFATSTSHPSYGYQVRHGATALTEAWDGPTRGLSQNHYMLGAIDAWFYRGLGGIGQAPGSNGFRRLLIAPAAPGDLESVRASTGTPYGQVSVSWERGDGEFGLEVTVPPGSSAEVRLPDLGLERHAAPEGAVAVGARAWEVPAGRWTFGARR
ncbi:family 78 glycoside hydrolase catalytic domain [Nonomuraea sp. NPDC049709]|uniref:family 78 glycoside hydrolase catalytic domain n=1 Tax=Nonomuraea sp. NPDC049709 TaxID=3154736 RepID=UPI00343254B6